MVPRCITHIHLAGKSDIFRATGRLETQARVNAAVLRQNSLFSRKP